MGPRPRQHARMCGLIFAMALALVPTVRAWERISTAEELRERLERFPTLAAVYFEEANQDARDAFEEASRALAKTSALYVVDLTSPAAGAELGVQYSPYLGVVIGGDVESTVQFDFFSKGGFDKATLLRFLQESAFEDEHGVTSAYPDQPVHVAPDLPSSLFGDFCVVEEGDDEPTGILHAPSHGQFMLISDINRPESTVENLASVERMDSNPNLFKFVFEGSGACLWCETLENDDDLAVHDEENEKIDGEEGGESYEMMCERGHIAAMITCREERQARIDRSIIYRKGCSERVDSWIKNNLYKF